MVHDAIKQLMQTHTEKDALDHLQKRLESMRTKTSDPNWKGFATLLGRERKEHIAQLEQTAQLQETFDTCTVGGSTVGGSTGVGGWTSGGATLGVAAGAGGGATTVGGVGGGTPGGGTTLGGGTTPGGPAIGGATLGGGATIDGGTALGGPTLGGGPTPVGATPVPLPPIPSQASYPHVRELQRSELRNATYAPTYAPSVHHTPSGLPTTNCSWPPPHGC